MVKRLLGLVGTGFRVLTFSRFADYNAMQAASGN